MMIALAGLMMARPAAAQDDILAIPEAEAPPPPAPAPISPPAAQAPDAGAKALAIRYFERCTQETLLEQEFDMRALFCSCSAERAMELLTPEQLKALAAGEGLDMDPDEFSARVQAPCLSYPLEQIEYRQCLRYKKNLFVTPEAHQSMCRCLSTGISQFVRDYGDTLMAMVLQRKKVRQEPLHDLTWSREYKGEFGKIRSACINRFAGQ